MNIAYKCKFCSKEGIVTIADDYPKDMIHIDKWIPKLCCERCCKFMERRRSMLAVIQKLCFGLTAARQTLDEAKSGEAERKARGMLEVITKRFASLVCDYYHKSNVWDSEFVNLLIEKPDQWYGIASHYVRGISQMRA